MPLDNAQFISELSITDPEGTDPLNQGDDQIRTTKRATQQSFPNIDAPVPQTAAQMGQMAIKNEVNTFTQRQIFQAQIESANGVALAPGYSFTTSLDTGMYLVQAADIGWATGGVRRMRLRNSELELTVPIRGQFGSEGAPAYSFDTEENMGMFREGASQLAFSVAGANRMRISNAQITDFLFHVFSSIGTSFTNFNNNVNKSGSTQIGGFNFTDGAGVGRWLIGQSTANNLENFFLQRRNSSGVIQDVPWRVNNTDGHIRMLNVDMERRIDTENSVIAWKTAGLVTRHTLNFENTGGFNPQSLTHSTFNSSGAFLGNVLRFGPNGEVFMEFLPTTNPGGSNRLWKSSGFVAIT